MGSLAAATAGSKASRPHANSDRPIVATTVADLPSRSRTFRETGSSAASASETRSRSDRDLGGKKDFVPVRGDHGAIPWRKCSSSSSDSEERRKKEREVRPPKASRLRAKVGSGGFGKMESDQPAVIVPLPEATSAAGTVPTWVLGADGSVFGHGGVVNHASGEWLCPRCKWRNFNTRKQCVQCKLV